MILLYDYSIFKSKNYKIKSFFIYYLIIFFKKFFTSLLNVYIRYLASFQSLFYKIFYNIALISYFLDLMHTKFSAIFLKT